MARTQQQLSQEQQLPQQQTLSKAQQISQEHQPEPSVANAASEAISSQHPVANIAISSEISIQPESREQQNREFANLANDCSGQQPSHCIGSEDSSTLFCAACSTKISSPSAASTNGSQTQEYVVDPEALVALKQWFDAYYAVVAYLMEALENLKSYGRQVELHPDLTHEIAGQVQKLLWSFEIFPWNVEQRLFDKIRATFQDFQRLNSIPTGDTLDETWENYMDRIFRPETLNCLEALHYLSPCLFHLDQVVQKCLTTISSIQLALANSATINAAAAQIIDMRKQVEAEAPAFAQRLCYLMQVIANGDASPIRTAKVF